MFRTACDTVMYEDGDRFQAKQIELEQGQDHLFIPGVEFTAKERLKNVNFLLWHDKRFEQAIPLISNLDEPELIMQAGFVLSRHKKRMSPIPIDMRGKPNLKKLKYLAIISKFPTFDQFLYKKNNNEITEFI